MYGHIPVSTFTKIRKSRRPISEPDLYNYTHTFTHTLMVERSHLMDN